MWGFESETKPAKKARKPRELEKKAETLGNEKSGITLPGELVKAYVSFIFDLRIRDKKLVLAQRSSNSLTSQPPKFSLDLGPFSGL